MVILFKMYMDTADPTNNMLRHVYGDIEYFF